MPAPAGAAPLPCLFSDNSDETPRATPATLSSEQRKTAHALCANVVQFTQDYGLRNCGFLTITFDPKSLRAEAERRGISLWQEAQRRFNNAHRRLLRPLFSDYIRVLEFQENGSPHYHLVVDCGGDITTGFDWEHYERTRDYWSRAGRKGPKPVGDLNRTPLLKQLHDQLRVQGLQYGLGRIELVPIRSNAEAIGRYVGGYLSYSLGGKRPEHKGARLVCYSSSFDRAYKGRFAWLDGKAHEWRRKLEIWATGHGCADLEQVTALFGSKWAYHHRENIERIELNETNKRERECIGGDLEHRRSSTGSPGERGGRTCDVHLPGASAGTATGVERSPGEDALEQLEALSEANQKARGGPSLPQRNGDQGKGNGLASNLLENDSPQQPQSEPRKYVLGTPWAKDLTEVSQEAGAKRLAAKMRAKAQYRKAVPQLVEQTYPHLAAKLRKRWDEAQPGQADEPF